MFPKPRIVISKCIGFEPCRYNGEIVQDKFVTRLEPHVEFVCVCPEVEIGLGTPRAPVRIVASGDSLKLIQPSSGVDLSDSIRNFSSGFLDALQEVAPRPAAAGHAFPSPALFGPPTDFPY